MALKDDIDGATAQITQGTTDLRAATAALVALQIQPPPDTTALLAAVKDNTAAVADAKAAVAAEATKLNPA